MFCSQGKTSTFKLTSAKGPAQLGMGCDSNEKQETFQKGQVKMSKGFFKLWSFRKKKKIIITKYALWLKNVLETIKTDKRFDYQAAAFNK